MSLLMLDSVNDRPSLVKFESFGLDEFAVRWVDSSWARRTYRDQERDTARANSFLFLSTILTAMLVFTDEVK